VRLTVGADLLVTADATPSPADALVLSAFGEPVGEMMWQIDRIRLLDAVDAGRSLDELFGFLEEHGAEIPPNLHTSADAVRRALQQIADLGTVQLMECVDEALAGRLASEPNLRRLCRRIGPNHLAVDLAQAPAFRKALRDLGLVLDGSRGDRHG
jgi:hypothetical protein